MSFDWQLNRSAERTGYLLSQCVHMAINKQKKTGTLVSADTRLRSVAAILNPNKELWGNMFWTKIGTGQLGCLRIRTYQSDCTTRAELQQRVKNCPMKLNQETKQGDWVSDAPRNNVQIDMSIAWNVLTQRSTQHWARLQQRPTHCSAKSWLEKISTCL